LRARKKGTEGRKIFASFREEDKKRGTASQKSSQASEKKIESEELHCREKRENCTAELHGREKRENCIAEMHGKRLHFRNEVRA